MEQQKQLVFIEVQHIGDAGKYVQRRSSFATLDIGNVTALYADFLPELPLAQSERVPRFLDYRP